MQEQKKYHQRKLAIIEMIETVQTYINRWDKFIIEMPSELALKNARFQKQRMENLKEYLLKRYNN